MAVEISTFQAVLFGIVQGLTEFLPVSSSAHLRILPAVIGMDGDPGAAFTAVIQLGTVAAVLIYFAKDLGKAFMGWLNSLLGKQGDPLEAQIGWAVFAGSLPIMVVGFLAKDFISSDSVRSLYVIASTLIVFGLVMLVAEKVGSKKRDLSNLRAMDGVVIGLWQVLALIPGVSRSGSTISGGYFSGFDRATAARFSFLLSVPSVVVSGLYELVKERKEIMGPALPATIIATVISFIVGYAAIAFLIKWVSKHGIGVFVGYRILLGIALIALLQAGILKAQPPAPVAGAPPTAAILSTPPPAQEVVTPEHVEAWNQAMRQQDDVSP